MSLAIEVDNVNEVLLADGWHVVSGQSFTLDAYEYVWGEQTLHGGGNSGVCSIGFEFRDVAGQRLSGPLSAVLAVKVAA